MSNNITAIGVTKRKNGVLKIKFTENLQRRLRRCTPVSDFEILNFVELPQPSTKLQALEFIANHQQFQDANVHELVMSKLNRYSKKSTESVHVKTRENVTVQDILDATV